MQLTITKFYQFLPLKLFSMVVVLLLTTSFRDGNNTNFFVINSAFSATDDFSSDNYMGGTGDWIGNWTEAGDDDTDVGSDPLAGYTQVVSNRLQFELPQNTAATISLDRSVDVTNVNALTVSFDWTKGGQNRDATTLTLDAQYSTDGGATFVSGIFLNSNTLFGGGTTSTFDISNLDAVNTLILRFEYDAEDNDTQLVTVDNVSLTAVPSFKAFAIQASCVNDVAQNDAYLQLSSASSADRVGFSLGATYTGPNYAGATDISSVSFPFIIASGIANPATTQAYTIRVFNGSDGCFVDQTVTLANQTCVFGCECDEFLYLNDRLANETLKFRANPDGSLSMIGSPWLDNIAAPHGLGVDLDGNLYIAQTPFSNFGDIFKIKPDGTVLDREFYRTSKFPFQIFSDQNNTLFFNRDASPEVLAIDICNVSDGDPLTDPIIGSSDPGMNTTGGSIRTWGAYVNPRNGDYWITDANSLCKSDGGNPIYKGNTADVIGAMGANVFTPFPVDEHCRDRTGDGIPDRFRPNGIFEDQAGNIYVVYGQTAISPGNESYVAKYDAMGNLVAQSAIDLDDTDGGWFDSRGLVVGENGFIYVSSEDGLVANGETCVTVFEDDGMGNLVELPALRVNAPAGKNTEAKTINLAKSCCPTSNRASFEEEICYDGSGDQKLFLGQILAACNGGAIGEGTWTQVTTNANITYDVCDNSITVTGSGCVNFILASDGTGPFSECGAFQIEVEICAKDCSAIASIGNYVWVDEDSNGLQDEGEVGIPNVVVNLFLDADMDGTLTGAELIPVATTVTDSDGGYLFPDLPQGDYIVQVFESTLPAGLTQTTIFTNPGSDLGNQDNGDGADPNTGYAISLGVGEENLTADFGYNYNPTMDVNNPAAGALAALGDRVWIDSDGDGVQDPNEVGVSGVEITLTGAGPDGIFGNGDDITQTTLTDENGYYIFDNLPAGAYTTAVTDDTGASHPILGADYAQTGDPDNFGQPAIGADNAQTTPIILGPGDVFLNSDYGYQPQMGAAVGSIGNTIWFDADADGDGPADADGDSDGSNGNGVEGDQVEEPIAGVSVSLILDLNGDGVWDIGEPIVATDVTDENGMYLFEGLPLDDLGGDGDADYIVWVNDTDNVLDGLTNTFDQDGGAGTDATGIGNDASMVGGLSAVALDSANPDDRDQDFGYTVIGNEPGDGFIGNFVWFDQDGNDSGGQADAEADGDSGLEGVVVELLDDMGMVIATTTTDENGFYFFGGLPLDETYTVQIAASNFMAGGVLEGTTSTYEPDNDNDNLGQDITLTAAMPGNLDQDFGYTGTGTVGSIGSTVWEDTNADGIQNADEANNGFEGVTIDLYRDLNGNGQLDPGEPLFSSTTTDANGDYLFENLPLGDYIVDVTDEDGLLGGYWHSTADNQDPYTDITGDTADNALDLSKEDAFAVTIGGTQPNNNLNVDFGYYVQPAAVGNYVWLDTNMDGIQDDTEMGIEGVQVTMDITYPNGTVVTLVTTTDANGFYEFPNLLYDEDYAIGAGAAENDPSSPAIGMPQYTISIDMVGQADMAGDPLFGLVPTAVNAQGAGQQPSDSEDINGVNVVPIQGSQNTTADADETLEAIEAQYDFGFTTGLVGIGGTIFADQGTGGGTQNDGTQDGGELGIGGVLVELLNDMGMVVATTTTAADGTYLFEGLQPGDYQIRIPDTNFAGPLSGLPFSSVPTTSADNDDSDNDDNGTQTVTNGTVTSPVFTLSVGGEPNTTGEILTNTQDGTDGTTRDSNTNTTVDFGFQDVVLPVELLSFDAKADKDHIDLAWVTASETNNSHFELERSEDAKAFKAIGKIQGQGTTLETTEYAYADETVVSNVLYYYRLKQMDIDGNFEYSNVVSARIKDGKGEMTVYPNPIGDEEELTVELFITQQNTSLQLVDMQGRIIRVYELDQAAGWINTTLDISTLESGTYFLKSSDGQVKRFVKLK